MNISNRLKQIASYVKTNSIVGDVGTDHGYIPIYLIKNNISKKVIASDISKPSLEKTVGYVKDLLLDDKIDTRLGNGLEVFKPYEIDTLIMAGMGGILIRDLLEKDREIADSVNEFIFQPMIASEELRKYLYKNNFKIINESIVKEDGKFYEIIHAKKGIDYLEDNIYLDIGKKLFENNDPLLKEFIDYKIEYKKSILDKIGKNDTENSRIRYNEVKDTIIRYEEVLNLYESI